MQLLFVPKCNNISTIWACGKSSSLDSSLDCCWHLKACESAMCVKPKLRIFVVFRCPCYYHILICYMWLDCLAPNSNETQDFDGELQVFWQNMQKKMVHVLNLFFSFMVSFQKVKAYNTLATTLNTYYKGLGLVIQFINKGKNYKLRVRMIPEYCFHSLFQHTSFYIRMM